MEDSEEMPALEIRWRVQSERDGMVSCVHVPVVSSLSSAVSSRRGVQWPTKCCNDEPPGGC